MKVRLIAAMLALAVAPAVVRAAEEENPYKKVKVGDFATYKMTTTFGGNKYEGTVTQTIKAKNDKEATIEVISKVNGTELKAQEQKIDLTKPYDPAKSTSLPKESDAKVEKVKEGSEKLKIGGKELHCKWEVYKVKAMVNGEVFEGEMKVWMTKDFPLPLVKLEMQATVADKKLETTMELQDAGSK